MKPMASVSLDLDNLWSYMKTHGDPGWEEYPSYLDILVPRVLEFFGARQTKITFFVVGQDAALEKNRGALGEISRAGHGIGNHSFRHEPWLHRYSPEEVRTELQGAHEAIERATGVAPIGFRGPGFSFSPVVLATLRTLGYRYDASTLPTFIGPLARAYYFASTKLTPEQRADRKGLFGQWSDGLRPILPYRWQLEGGTLIEIPVTTMPGFRFPFHLSYILYLSSYSAVLARSYFRAALALCRMGGVEPSILLHPLDFLGADDTDTLKFFPGMNLSGKVKRARVGDYLDDLARRFQVVSLDVHAAALAERQSLPTRRPT